MYIPPMTLSEFLSQAWPRYTKLTPDAAIIHKLLTERGETIINDHIAFRTFNIKEISKQRFGQLFESWGYKRADETLEFPEKHLLAHYYVHPDKTQPKLFISELILEECSTKLRDWILTTVLSAGIKKLSAELLLQNSWSPIRYEDYRDFYNESEYAAWTMAFGIQVNHFTVLANALTTFKSIAELNTFLLSKGLELNNSGGLVKGSPKDFLEQSSTQAKPIPCQFANGRIEEVPGCYYEFALRYPLPGTTELFQGFVPKSADKIFESTFEKR